jgi:hypothetical protein
LTTVLPFPVSNLTGARQLVLTTGNGSFAGNGQATVSATVTHNLQNPVGTPVTPVFVTAFPALESTGAFWSAEFGQASPADDYSFYLDAYAAGGFTFGTGYTYYFNWIAFG